MIHREKCLVLDVDATLCEPLEAGQTYADARPNGAVIETLRKYRAKGFYVIIQTSRNMRTYDGNVGLIVANTVPVLLEWLRRHDVPFDEMHIGKPWPGRGGFCVDDKAIRPSEFTSLSYERIMELVGND